MHANSNFGSTSCPLILAAIKKGRGSCEHERSECERGYCIFKVVVAIGTRPDIAAAGLQIDIRLMGWA
jgi:hypothetical protein